MKSIFLRPATAFGAACLFLGSAGHHVHADRVKSSDSSFLRVHTVHRRPLMFFQGGSWCSKWCCKLSKADMMVSIDRDVAELESVAELDPYKESVADVAEQYRGCAALYHVLGGIGLVGYPLLVWPLVCHAHQAGRAACLLDCAGILQVICFPLGVTLCACGCCMRSNASEVDRDADMLDSPRLRAHLAGSSPFAGVVPATLAVLAVLGLLVCTASAVRGKNARVNRFRPEEQLLVVESTMLREQPRHLWHGQHGEGATFVNPILDSQLALGARPLLAGEEAGEEFGRS